MECLQETGDPIIEETARQLMNSSAGCQRDQNRNQWAAVNVYSTANVLCSRHFCSMENVLVLSNYTILDECQPATSKTNSLVSIISGATFPQQ